MAWHSPATPAPVVPWRVTLGFGALLVAGCGPGPEPPGVADHADGPAVADEAIQDGQAWTPPARDAALTILPTEPAVPVAGVSWGDLRDTFGQPRRGARRHGGIDILAPRGTPVLAAMDGWVVNIRREGPGGLALHLLDRSGTYIFYYAHLDRFADRVRPGRAVRQGDLLGYVGDTGNAAGRSPHLHFEVASVEHPRRWWDHERLNPHAFLTGGLAGAP